MAVRITHVGEGQNQNKSRLVKIFFDQHKEARLGFPDGRAWWGYCEKQVDGSDAQPIGELMPVGEDKVLEDGTRIKGWSAPWVPEPKYIALAVAGMTGYKFRIDYVRMQRDYEDASRRYYDLVNNEVFQKGWDPIPLYGSVPYVVRALKHVGAPPKSPKLPEAALAGDRWLLGFSEEVNEKLRDILAIDNGRLAATPEYEPRPDASLAQLSPEDMAELQAFLQARKKSHHKKTPTPAEAA